MTLFKILLFPERCKCFGVRTIHSAMNKSKLEIDHCGNSDLRSIVIVDPTLTLSNRKCSNFRLNVSELLHNTESCCISCTGFIAMIFKILLLFK